MRMTFTLQHLVRVRCFNVGYFRTLRVSDLLSLVPLFDYRIVTGSTWRQTTCDHKRWTFNPLFGFI